MKHVVLIFMSILWTHVMVAQPALGLINDFEDGSLSGWRKGNANNNPNIIESGGPGGVDDAFLRLISDGSQSGGKWIIYNTTNDWTGDWIEAGVVSLQMNVRNNSNMEVTMRLALGTANSQMNNGAIFSSGVAVPANSDWVTIEIPVKADDFSGGNANNTLSNVGVLRILHNNNPSWNGANVVASIDIDNITAIGETVVEDLVINCSVTQDVSETGGSDGSANINITGGTTPYSISVNGFSQDGSPGDNLLDNLTAGIYEITVNDNDSMSASCNFEITEPTLEPLVINCSVLEQVSEAGGMDGVASAGITGGTLPYTINIEAENFSEMIVGSESMYTFDNLLAGNYTITVIDTNDTSVTCNFTISEPLPPFSFQNFEASLTGKNQLALVQTLGYGEFLATLSNDTLTISGNVDNLSSPIASNIGGGAHIHLGLQGQNGPVVFPLNTSLDEDSLGGIFLADSNQFIVDSSIASALLQRGLYINIHTQSHPGGEIRGQLVPMNNGLYSSNLLGTNTIPSTMTLAQGSAILDIVEDRLTLSGTFENLEGDFTICTYSHRYGRLEWWCCVSTHCQFRRGCQRWGFPC